MRKLLAVCWITCQIVCVSLVERVGVSRKDLDLRRVPTYSLVFSDPIVKWILQEPENDAPKSSEDHCQQATGASARPVMVLGESCFGNHVTGTQDLECLSTGFVPKNTDENTQWALHYFEFWCVWRRTQMPDNPVPLGKVQTRGQNTLNSLVKMCEKVGITGKTNHSLRARKSLHTTITYKGCNIY